MEKCIFFFIVNFFSYFPCKSFVERIWYHLSCCFNFLELFFFSEFFREVFLSMGSNLFRRPCFDL